MERIRQPSIKGILQLRTVKKRVSSLIRTPFFWLITLWGNTCVLGGAISFYQFEKGKNPEVHGFLDSLSWAVGMVTTVGGGNINPVTLSGKVLSILMMMGGALFLWSYMALFVGAFVDPELKDIEREVSELQHDMEEGEQLLGRLRSLTEELEGHLTRQRQEHRQGNRLQKQAKGR